MESRMVFEKDKTLVFSSRTSSNKSSKLWEGGGARSSSIWNMISSTFSSFFDIEDTLAKFGGPSERNHEFSGDTDLICCCFLFFQFHEYSIVSYLVRRLLFLGGQLLLTLLHSPFSLLKESSSDDNDDDENLISSLNRFLTLGSELREIPIVAIDIVCEWFLNCETVRSFSSSSSPSKISRDDDDGTI